MTGTATQDAGALLAELASFAPEAVVIATDRAGRVVAVSGPARDRLFREGQPGLHVTELLAAGDAHGVTALLAGAPGRAGPRLVNLVDASGELFTVRAVLDAREDGLLLAGLRVVDEESRLGAELVRLNNELVAATRESARKGRELEKALAELRRHRDLLEELVAERTSRLVLANDGLRSEIAARDRAETRRREAEAPIPT